MYNSFKLLLRSYVQRRETNPLISFVVVQRRPRLRGSAEAKWMQNGGEEEEEGRVEKRRATVFELKVERKWRRGWEATRDSSYEEETATVDYRRFENLWTRSSLFPSLPPLSLSLLLGTAHPAQCSEKAKPTREDLGVTLYSVVTDASKEISFSLSLSLAPLRMETSRHFFHHGLIQCLLTCTPHFPLTSYIRRYIPHTPSYNVSTIFLRISPSFKRRVFFERSGASMEVRRFVSHLDFALYSVVGIARSKKFRNVRKAQVLLYVFIRIYAR